LTRTAVLAALIMAAALAVAGCYSPKIQDGGLVCAPGDGGDRCPDGFECNAVDNHCYRSGGQCAKAAPLCQDAPKAGSACNPVCQTGCDCGRCNISGLAAVCSPLIGPKKLGDVCTPQRDDCDAGLICLLEACGSNLGRCYRHCATAAQCAAGVACGTPILDGTGTDTGFLTCDLAPRDCDPIARTGCPSPALTCFVGASAGGAGASGTFCDCPGRALPEDSTCDAPTDCAAGLTCASGAGVSGKRCRPICLANGPACPSGQRCVTASAARFGYCGS
jgi:hypothetical protein